MFSGKKINIVVTALIAGLCTGLRGQESGTNRLSAAFSDPSKPGTVEVSLINGGISVTGYEGKEVFIESDSKTLKIGGETHGEPQKEKAKGLRRITAGASGIEVEEKDNRMDISSAAMGSTVQLTLRVPFKTSLKLTSVNNGDIRVDNVEGDLEIEAINGEIALNNVSGSVMAHALNGNLTAVFNRVDPQKPMSFSSMNGDIDVTFPALLKADVRLKNKMGETYTDFDVVLEPKTTKTEEDGRKSGGKFKIEIDRALAGKINGGGPEIQFENFNGDIYLRKK